MQLKIAEGGHIMGIIIALSHSIMGGMDRQHRVVVATVTR